MTTTTEYVVYVYGATQFITKCSDLADAREIASGFATDNPGTEVYIAAKMQTFVAEIVVKEV